MASVTHRPPDPDQYGFARSPERIDKIQYGRFRNVYLYITEKCHLRCKHCYMGERLERELFMPYAEVEQILTAWRKMGGSKLSILGGEPTLHPDFKKIVKLSHDLGYEQVILNTHGLKSARRVLQSCDPSDFSYIQVSVDGGSAETHERVRGPNTFRPAMETCEELAERGFDTRIICTVNRANIGDCLSLIEFADKSGVFLVKYHVFSGIGRGVENDELLISPPEWIEFCDRLESIKEKHSCQIWYQPTYIRREDLARYADEGYRGCIGRTLDRISIFPDGRAYVCSYLFDTDLNYATTSGGRIKLNPNENEFDHFTEVLSKPSCGSCANSVSCSGGCPAESLVMGASSCATYPDIVPVCRLWKSRQIGSTGLEVWD